MLHTLFYLSLCSLCLCLSICLSVCLSVCLSLSHSLTLCFSILCIGLSLWVYVHAQVLTCEDVLYVFISLHNLESRARCFGLRIYLPNSFQVRWVLRSGSPTSVHTFVSIEQIINLWWFLASSPELCVISVSTVLGIQDLESLLWKQGEYHHRCLVGKDP